MTAGRSQSMDIRRLSTALHSDDPKEVQAALDEVRRLRRSDLKLFGDGLASQDLDLHDAAAHVLGEIGNAAAIRLLTPFWRCKDDRTRCVPVAALQNLAQRQRVERLAALLDGESSEVREVAAWMLSFKHTERVARLLAGALKDPDSHVRAMAARGLDDLYSLASERMPPVPVAVAIDLLKDASLYVRAAAASLLGHSKGQKVFAALSSALKDEHYWVRHEAARAIMATQDRRAADALLSAVADPHPEVRCAVAYALSRTQTWFRKRDATVPQVLAEMLKDTEADVRAAAAEGLAWLQEPSAVDALRAALEDESPAVRSQAMHALGAAGDSASVDLFLDQLRNGDDQERHGAADALGELQDPRALEPLIAALNDEYNLVQMAAASALGQLGDVTAVKPLIGAFRENEDADVRDSIVHALDELGDERAIDVLLEALEDDYKYVKTGAARALADFGDVRAIEPLTNLLKDEDEYVREVAQDALKRIRKSAAAGREE